MKAAAVLQALLLLSAVHARPQGILSDIASVFGFGDNDPTSTSVAQTLVPPATASSTSTKAGKTKSSLTDTTTATVTSNTKSSKATVSSSTTDTDSASTGTSTSDSSTITSAPTISTSNTTNTPTVTPTSASTTSTASSTSASFSQPTSSPSSSNGVPPGGIAVAVIMTLAILAVAAWLVFRYNPTIRRHWLAHQEKKMQERSYRDAIDGPFANGGSGVRNDSTFDPTRKSMLASFFAPRTVKLGNGKEIRRKPVNWGAGHTSPAISELPGNGGMEKVALTNMAAPMARTGSTVSNVSYHSGAARASPISSVGGGGGAGSNRSSPAIAQKELPPMPPMPPMPAEPLAPQKGGVHGILSRKSIFELA